MSSRFIRARLVIAVVAAIIVFISGNGIHAAPEGSHGQCVGAGDFPSPDGALYAHVIRLQGDFGCGESRVDIHDTSRMLTSANFASADREHGWGIERAAWTPDSEFFVFSMSSSGGHEPTHFPTFFYSRKANAIRSLEDVLKNVLVSDPEFRILPPNTIEVAGWSVPGQHDTSVRVDLRGTR